MTLSDTVDVSLLSAVYYYYSFLRHPGYSDNQEQALYSVARISDTSSKWQPELEAT